MNPYQNVEDGLNKYWNSTGVVPPMRSIARELGVTPKLIKSLYPGMYREIIKRYYEDLKKAERRTAVVKPMVGISRKCLRCDSDFSAPNKYIRMCEACKRATNWDNT